MFVATVDLSLDRISDRRERCRQVLREETGQKMLESEDSVEKKCTDEAKDHEAACILTGIHLYSGIDCGDAINPSFHWNP